ncbi:stage II sporulation protein M [Peribacillus sp. NJ4]|uniref:stage II sporulation protein M n=1 Tax=Peribacillus sp. NJ4 TaxID=3055862 RepID=UPI0025A09D6C|nr:stage II sporulation protein M [Peribacillus sp. NJ4]MDM5214854.1 stage II sporulation protein M [Peribacillus sp. NJ4]
MTFKKVVSLVTLIALLLYILGLFFPMDLEKEPIDESFGFTALFFHNLQAQFTAILLGCITLGVYSIIYLFINFFSMGFITATLLTEDSVGDVVSMFMVHGIFEIPAMILSISLGIYIPWKLIGMIRNKAFNQFAIRNTARIFIIILLLTVFAAAVEAFITPKLI